ncbi:E3 ubiquitin-protein ligase ubr1 [Dispira simplex]|nr:E3 ubiquitin-protein ligase ubr1 [Dispira simplex]
MNSSSQFDSGGGDHGNARGNRNSPNRTNTTLRKDSRPIQRRRRKDFKSRNTSTTTTTASTSPNTPRAPPPTETIPLLTYLLQAHKQYGYILDDRAKREIITKCNEYFFSKDQSFLTLVNESQSHSRKIPPIPLIYRDTDEAYYSMSESECDDLGSLGIEYSESRRGKPCGHVFSRGEGVYRCRNCSLDDTCVLCARCFRASDHTGHDTSFSVNSGTGGCCDCGDPEAWRVPIVCKYHSLRPDQEVPQAREVPEHIIPGMKATIATVLDFMLGTFCTSKDLYNVSLEEKSIYRDLQRANTVFGEHEAHPIYSTVLWNDDTHSFQEVIDQLMDGINADIEKVREITDRVHVSGRDVILTTPDIQQSITVAKYMASIRLQVTIRSARDVFREQLCAVLLLWLKDLSKASSEKYQALNHAYDGNFNGIIKAIICEELTAPWPLYEHNEQLRKMLVQDNFVDDAACEFEDPDLIVDFDEDEERMFSEGMVPTHSEDKRLQAQLGGLQPLLQRSIQEADRQTLASGSSQVMEKLNTRENKGGDIEEGPEHGGTIRNPVAGNEEIARKGQTTLRDSNTFQHRLDWFLLYDMRLWHEVRAGLRELYMATLTLSMEYKKRIAVSFATNYDALSRSFLLMDKGPEHSIILFSVQLFTVPTIAYTLAHDHQFLYTILRILKRFFIKENDPALLRQGIIDCDAPAFRNRRYFHVFHDMRYITGTETCTMAISGDVKFLGVYLRFLCLFQGMDPMRRQKGNHVEYEVDTWINAFNVTLQLAKSCRQLASCYFAEPVSITQAIRHTLRIIYRFSLKSGEERGGMNILSNNPEKLVLNFQPSDFRDITTLWGTTYPVLRYSVSDNYISFHHPLHWFLGQLLHCLEYLDPAKLATVGWQSFKELIWSFDDPLWEDGCPYKDRPEGGQDMGAMLQANPDLQRKLLVIFDYPVRVCCLMSQIRSYLWVRNGHIAKSSAAHYCEICLRHNTYDLDVFLVQVAFTLLDPDHMLLTIIDRYELLDFFSEKYRPEKHPSYDPSQLLHMVELFLNLLVVCMSERSIVAGLTLKEQARRYIVHGTITQIAYTDLMRQIPDRMSELTIYDQIINQVANFRPPTSTNDIGYYQLKDDQLDEVDPYFIHYSRNKKAEAEQRLRQHAQAQKAARGLETSTKSVFAHTPLLHISRGPYTRLGNMLQGRLACQVMFYALYHALLELGSSVSDTIIDYTIHLLYLAVKDKNNDYYREPVSVDESTTKGEPTLPTATIPLGGIWVHVKELKFPVFTKNGRRQQMDLLTLILKVMSRQECLHWAGKLEYIVETLCQFGSPEVQAAIRQHQETQQAEYTRSKAEAEAHAARLLERKRQAAREKQRKMMESFIHAQNRFIANHTRLYEDLEVEDEEHQSDRAASSASSHPRPGSSAGAPVKNLTDVKDIPMEALGSEPELNTANSALSTRPTSSASIRSRSSYSRLAGNHSISRSTSNRGIHQQHQQQQPDPLGLSPARGLAAMLGGTDTSGLAGALAESQCQSSNRASQTTLEIGDVSLVMDGYSDEDLEDEEDEGYDSPMDEDLEEADYHHSEVPTVEWETPGGSCIVCQENLDSTHMYGMVALAQRSKHLRKLPTGHRRFVLELLNAPESLDKECPRPSPLKVRGVETAFSSHPQNPAGFTIQGFPSSHMIPGMYISSCGHMMHLHCFDTFYTTIETRHSNQPTRNAPENLQRREFMCPFCKALGNVLIPALHSVPQIRDMAPLYFEPPKPQVGLPDLEDPPKSPGSFPSWWRSPLSLRAHQDHADGVMATVARSAQRVLLGALVDLRVCLSKVRAHEVMEAGAGPSPQGYYPGPHVPVSSLPAPTGSTGRISPYLNPMTHFPRDLVQGMTVGLNTPPGSTTGPHSGFATLTPPSSRLDGPSFRHGETGGTSGGGAPYLAWAVMTQTATWEDPVTQSNHQYRPYLAHQVFYCNSSTWNTREFVSWDRVLNGLDFGPSVQPHSHFTRTPRTFDPLPLTPELAGLCSSSTSTKNCDSGETAENELTEAMQAILESAEGAYQEAQNIQARLQDICMFSTVADAVKVLYFRLAEIMHIHMTTLGHDVQQHQFDKLLVDTYYYTLSSLEATARGVPHGVQSGTVLDSVNESTTSMLHMVSDLILHYYNLIRLSSPRQDWLKLKVRQRSALWLTKLLQPHVLYRSTATEEESQTPQSHPRPISTVGSAPSPYGRIGQPTAPDPRIPGFPPGGHNFAVPPSYPTLAMDGIGQNYHDPSKLTDQASPCTTSEGLFSSTSLATSSAVDMRTLFAQPLLLEDPFQVLVELSMFVVPEYAVDTIPLVNLLFLAELVRTVLGLVECAVRPDKKEHRSWMGQDSIRNNEKIRELLKAYQMFDVYQTDPLADQATGAAESRAAKQSQQQADPLTQAAEDAQGHLALDGKSHDVRHLIGLTSWLMQLMGFTQAEITNFHQRIPGVVLAKLVRILCLPFLRKTVLLLHTHHGVSFQGAYPVVLPDQTKPSPENDLGFAEDLLAPSGMVGASDNQIWRRYSEFDRLLYLLNIPPLVELCRVPDEVPEAFYTRGHHLAEDQPRGYLYGLIAEWCQHLKATVPIVNAQLADPKILGDPNSTPVTTLASPTGNSGRASTGHSYYTSPIPVITPLTHNNPLPLVKPLTVKLPPIPLVFPGIMELTVLPTGFDYLFEASSKVVCPKCKKIPQDPALCMFCGQFVCIQSFCCSDDFYGECNLHMMMCSGPIGIFLVVKSNTALLLWNDSGSFIVTPYRDYHGEMDLGLKRGRPLFLDQKRYDELRRTWLTHQVPNLVARTLENVFDTGGWITL